MPDAALLTQLLLNGLTFGALIALIALGYTMVYGIVELINFAHGDLFMLGTFFALTILAAMGLTGSGINTANTGKLIGAFALMILFTPLFCAFLNVSIEYVIYKPLRNAPKLAPLVSAIGVSFCLMNLGMFWNAMLPENGASVPSAADRNFPQVVPDKNLLASNDPDNPPDSNAIKFTLKNAIVIGVTIPMMVLLTLFVKFTALGKAMRATAQNPTAARLMGINVDRVISATFAIGGALAGVGSVIFATTINTIGFQIGYQNGLYAFTAAVLGGIGNIPGAVLGAIIIGLIRSFGSYYINETWTSALVFVILIVILVFRPTGLLGSRVREKV
ncbi:MAG: branched-chain amino acid ABC transporter permease [Gemmataceae bacterium]